MGCWGAWQYSTYLPTLGKDQVNWVTWQYRTYPADTELSTLQTMAGGATLKKIMIGSNSTFLEHSLKTEARIVCDLSTQPTLWSTHKGKPHCLHSSPSSTWNEQKIVYKAAINLIFYQFRYLHSIKKCSFNYDIIPSVSSPKSEINFVRCWMKRFQFDEKICQILFGQFKKVKTANFLPQNRHNLDDLSNRHARFIVFVKENAARLLKILVYSNV